VPFVDGVTRAVFEDAVGRQFVLNDTGNPQYGRVESAEVGGPAGRDNALNDGPRPDAVVARLAITVSGNRRHTHRSRDAAHANTAGITV
jgi:hypothetical protein